MIECALAHMILGRWFGRRDQDRIPFWLGMAVYFLINVCYTLLPLPPLARTVSAVLSVFIFARYFYNTTWGSAFVGAMISVILNVLSEYLTMVIMNTLHFDTSRLMEYSAERVCYIAVAKLVNIFVVLTAASILGRRRPEVSFKNTVPLLICLIISVLICETFYQASRHTQLRSGSFVLALLGLIYINLMMIMLFDSLTVSAVAKREQALTKQNYEFHKNYYEQLQREHTETRALWHDIKKYLLAMEAMVSAEDAGAGQALENIQEAFSGIGNLVDVDNQELNVILSHYLGKAKAAGIPVTLAVSVSPQLPISAIDLSVIIGNTVDNAIEACLRCATEERWMQISLNQRNHVLLYHIENSCLPDGRNRKGNAHGYGLKNVDASAGKYGGSVETAQKKGRFTVNVLLNLTE